MIQTCFKYYPWLIFSTTWGPFHCNVLGGMVAVGVVSNGDERGSRRARPQAKIGGAAISDHGRERTHHV